MGVLQNLQRYGYGRVTEFTEVPGIVAQAYITHRFSGYGIERFYTARTQGIVAQAYRTHRRSRYEYERHTELTKVPDTGTEVLQISQKFRVLWRGRTELTEVPGMYEKSVPVPRVLWHRRTELTEVLCRVIPG